MIFNDMVLSAYMYSYWFKFCKYKYRTCNIRSIQRGNAQARYMYETNKTRYSKQINVESLYKKKLVQVTGPVN